MAKMTGRALDSESWNEVPSTECRDRTVSCSFKFTAIAADWELSHVTGVGRLSPAPPVCAGTVGPKESDRQPDERIHSNLL